MENFVLPKKLETKLNDYVQKLKDIFQDDLISVILYGSAASKELVPSYSNLNMLAVIKCFSTEKMKKANALLRNPLYMDTLFLTKDYINNSLDVFPIEFLDMQENHVLLWGEDIFSAMRIDLKNLRFQCEQELKSKLIRLHNLYLKNGQNKKMLENALCRFFNSILHITRNMLRFKSKTPPYKKEEIIQALAAEFFIDSNLWNRVLLLRSNKLKLKGKEIEELFLNFLKELEKIIEWLDNL